MSGGAPDAARTRVSALIRIVDGRFEQDGVPIMPHGINSYPLLQLAGHGRWDAIREIFEQALAFGRPFVRTNAFLDGGDNPARLRDERGVLREAGFCALDRLLLTAAEHDVRLLMVLTNQWSDFGGAPAVLRAVSPDVPLPSDAFWTDPRAIDAQRAFVRALVSRINTLNGRAYASDPTVFAWELANEARCTGRARRSAAALTHWARSMTSEIRVAGALQPIAWGGSGHRHRHGENLKAIARCAQLDLLTLHLYPQLLVPGFRVLPERWRAAAAISAGSRVLRDRARLARRHRMPLLLEELGYRAPPLARDRDGERARVLQALLALAHQLDVPTYPWMIGEIGRPDHDGFLIRPSDTFSSTALRVQ